ncbi:MAG: PD-(D/E)XK nuclease family protein [Anaerovoracaceae bacterium]|jgi:ATP-dependent helicase/nuclease subunit B
MLNIYYGRENLNRDRFIYENIKGSTIVIVPDQFTVQAERDAFFYMRSKGIMEVEVLSFSRLADRIFSEQGGGRTPMIDRQGRHMLLTRIMNRLRKELGVYAGYGADSSFIDMVNDFISETKQYGKTPQDLLQITERLPENRYLRRKLEDISRIFAAYEEQIDGKYIDTEDRVSMMIDRIRGSQLAAGNTFWIYGFDYFAPKNRETILALIAEAQQVNLVMTWDENCADRDLFSITGGIMDDLEQQAEEQGIAHTRVQIGSEYEESRPGAIAALEKNLFAIPPGISGESRGMTLVRAAGYYAEAETAAAKVLQLVRDKGMRYRDIAIICNDLDTRGRIYKRVFSQYGIEIFVDEKRGIMNHPSVNYILSLIDVVAGAYRAEDVLRLVKTGLTELDREEAEKFENYVKTYAIRGPRFREEFTRGAGDLGQEAVAGMEDCRRRVIGPIMDFAAAYKEADDVESKVRCLYEHITGVCHLDEKTEAQIDAYIEDDELELAAESAQIWNVIVGVFDQMVEVTGDSGISQKDFAAMFRSGFEAVEIGLIPPALDGVLMGTMQRTRTGSVRALLVMGANEGVLPAESGDDGLLSEEEKMELADFDDGKLRICKLDRLRVQEENLAIYRNLARPAEELWISCSASDEDGKAIRPSRIFSALEAICPDAPRQVDSITAEDKLAMISAPEIGIDHLTGALRDGMSSGEVDPCWQETLAWYRENRPQMAENMRDGLLFSNQVGQISREEVVELYKRNRDVLSLSPSRLELFGKCPFSHFVRYGLRPDEPREFHVGPADMGDIYHRCLMRMARELTQDGVAITDVESPWMTVTREDCEEKTAGIIDEELGSYREGLFGSDRAESYRGRRAKEICSEAVWMMVEHVRCGRIDSMQQEVGFGRRKPIAPISIETSTGEEILIEGIIDRVDYLPGDNVKVIDYKSGNDKYSSAEALGGWKLQLLVYLRAACEGRRDPAGAFYFHITSPELKASSVSNSELEKKVADEIRTAFRMDGFMVNEEDVVECMDSSMDGGPSMIIPARRLKAGSVSGSGKVMSRDAMNDLMNEVNKNMDDMVRRLADGDIRILPASIKDMKACRYCRYKGICKFDVTFSGCRYRDIK